MTVANLVARILVPLLLCLHATDRGAIDAHVQKLGSRRFREREFATRWLLKKWPDAIPALKKALQSPDAEVARRAAAILEKFRRRPLERLRRFVREGKVDLVAEMMARWPKGKYEKACWQEICRLIARLSESRMKPAKAAKHDGWPKPSARFPPIVVSAKRITKTVVGPDKYLFLRAREVVPGPGSVLHGTVTFASGDVHFRTTCMAGAIFSGGSVRLDNTLSTVIVSDGDVVFGGTGASDCVIIARGKVTWRLERPINCYVISGKSVKFPQRSAVNCKILENQTTPLGWIHFFDPAEEGITVAKAKAGVAIAKLAAKKRFATAGLRKGDILTKIDKETVDSPESFRRLLRRHVAWEKEMTFHVLRGGKKLQVRIPRGE